MLELCWKGTKEVTLSDGSIRKFLKDGDEVSAACRLPSSLCCLLSAFSSLVSPFFCLVLDVCSLFSAVCLLIMAL
jgi:hypothetical protein